MATTARPRDEVRGLSRFVTDNFWLKLLSVALSVLLFSLVHSDVDAQRTIYLPVVQTLPPRSSGQMLISPLPPQVKVTLRGSRSKLSSLSRDEIPPLEIDLQDTTRRYYHFDPHSIDVGSNIQVIDISPATISLTWAVAAEKRVPVHVQLEGELDRRYALRGDIEVVPAYTTLRGPESVLQGLNTVSTEPVSLIGLGLGLHTRRVPLEPLPEHVSYVEDNAVEVRIEVKSALAERTFKQLALACLGEAQVTLRPDHVDVVLRAAPELLSELRPDALTPYVEPGPGGLSAAPRVLEVKLRGMPQDTELVEFVPPTALARARAPNRSISP